MQDQVRALEQVGVRACFINSTLSGVEIQKIEKKLIANEMDLLYVAPERLFMQRFLNQLKKVKISLFAIDEAHCISEWGHDFRPDYTRLREIRELLNSPTTIALTATATPDVRADVVKQLGLQDPEIDAQEEDDQEKDHVDHRRELEPRLLEGVVVREGHAACLPSPPSNRTLVSSSCVSFSQVS